MDPKMTCLLLTVGLWLLLTEYMDDDLEVADLLLAASCLTPASFKTVSYTLIDVNTVSRRSRHFICYMKLLLL